MTRLWKKLAARPARPGALSSSCWACQNGDCEDLGGASIDTTMDFVEGGQHAKKNARKTRQGPMGARQIKKGAKTTARQPQLGGRKGPDCDCDCHAIAASGRKAVIAMLHEGMDFSSVFTEDLFETADMDSEFQEQLAAFKWRTLAEDVSVPHSSRLW